jgi:hypothetical protein
MRIIKWDEPMPKDPIAISLVAQRIFNHVLLNELIGSGALSQSQAASIAGNAANLFGDYYGAEAVPPFADKLAEGFEQIAASVLGLPTIKK